MTGGRVELRSISPTATPEEVAAIVAAIAEVQRRAAAIHAPESGDPQRLDHWRLAGRLAHRRTGMARGPWRLSGRLARRVRA